MNQKLLAIRGLIVCAALLGLLGTFIEHSSASMQRPAQIIALVVVMVLIFVWVHHDSSERNYKRPHFLNAGLLILPLLFVPVYVVLSRNEGEKATALLRCVGFGAALFIITAVSEALIDLIWFAVSPS
jgi:glucose uptake protein GlcU